MHKPRVMIYAKTKYWKETETFKNNNNNNVYHSKKFEIKIFNVVEESLLCTSRLHFYLIKNTKKNSNIRIYYYN